MPHKEVPVVSRTHQEDTIPVDELSYTSGSINALIICLWCEAQLLLIQPFQHIKLVPSRDTVLRLCAATFPSPQSRRQLGSSLTTLRYPSRSPFSAGGRVHVSAVPGVGCSCVSGGDGGDLVCQQGRG